MGYKYAGTEYGQEVSLLSLAFYITALVLILCYLQCFCGNEFLGSGGWSFDDWECSTPCAGDSGTQCGNGWKLTIYKSGPAPSATNSHTEPTPSATVSGPISATESATESASVSATETMSESESVPTATANATSTSTEAPLPTSTAPPVEGEAAWYHVGCAADPDLNNRILSGSSHIWQWDLTADKCIDLCEADGYTYAGMEWGKECYCGNELKSGTEYVDEGECSMPCAGDNEETCGNDYRMDMYQVLNSPPPGCEADDDETSSIPANNNLVTNAPTMTSSAAPMETDSDFSKGEESTSAIPPLNISSTAAPISSASSSSSWTSSDLPLSTSEPSESLVASTTASFASSTTILASSSSSSSSSVVPTSASSSQIVSSEAVSTATSEVVSTETVSATTESVSSSSTEIGGVVTGSAEVVPTTTSEVVSSTFEVLPTTTSEVVSSTSEVVPTTTSEVVPTTSEVVPTTSSAAPTTTQVADPSATGTVEFVGGEIPGSSNSHEVYAHFMVGNTYPYAKIDWINDIKLAKDAGIDGFALNMGSDYWQSARIADAYAAAEEVGGFTMFLSLDMTVMSCSSSVDAANLVSLVSSFAKSSAQTRREGKTLVSTFSGENCFFGTGSVKEGWNSMFKSALRLVGTDIFFVPSVFSDPSSFASSEWMDGELNWNSAWPMGGTPLDTSSDEQYMAALGSKEYMPAISPYFFTHFGANSWNKNWIYRSDDFLYARRWEQLIAMRDRIKSTEILTWNDYGESSYIGPIKGALPAGSNAWVDGFEHDHLLHVTQYYVSAFKTGAYPTVTEDKIIVWARPHPKAAEASAAAIPRPDKWEYTDDLVYVLVFAKEDGVVTLTSGDNAEKYAVKAGLNKIKMPLGQGSIKATLARNSANVVSYDSTGQFSYDLAPQAYNFNYFVGSS